MMRDVAKLSRFLVAKSKQDPQVLFIHSQAAAISIIIAAIEAVMMMVLMVMMVVVVAPIARDHYDRRVVVIAIATIEAVMMVVVMMMIKLSELNVFAGFRRGRFIDGLQQGTGVRNRLQQVGV